VVDVLYEALLEPGLWAAALKEFANQFNAPTAILATCAADLSGPHVAWAGVDTTFQNLYAKSFLSGGDPVTVGPRKNQKELIGQPYTDRMVLTAGAFQKTLFYQSWCRPQHIETLLGAEVISDRRGIVLLGLGRSELFGDAELSLYRKLMPDLRRVMSLRLGLMRLDLRHAQLRNLLDAVGTPIMLANRIGRVLHANRAAEDLFRAGDLLRVAGGKIAAVTEPETDALRGLLQRAGSDGGGASLRLISRDGVEADILIVPTPENHGWAEGSDDCVAVFVARTTALNLQPALLRALYDLTPTEASVAILVSSGEGVADAAVALRMQTSTARTHLHRVFDKTGTRRQSQLARLLASLPRQE
jgi:DNA-binding CsgD family transcriptional regulator